MGRWLVQLSGERSDLEGFPYWFPDGEVYAIEYKGEFFLAGSTFENLASAETVRDAAVRALDRFAAVISLIDPSLRRPTIGSVLREDDGGTRTIFASATFSARATLRAAVVEPTGAVQQSQQRTQAQEMLTRATVSPHLELALLLCADQMRSWPRLYCIMEEIEQHLGMPLHAAGLCSNDQRERFKRTANSAEASGPDARHATGKFVAPKNPMSLREATEFIRQILLKLLQ